MNLVLPGCIETDRLGELDAANAKAQGKSVEDIVASAKATILAAATAGSRNSPTWSASSPERASYITGSTVRIDGGMICSVCRRRRYFGCTGSVGEVPGGGITGVVPGFGTGAGTVMSGSRSSAA